MNTQVEQKVLNVGIMVDTESLGLAPNSVVTQIAFIAFDMEDPETILRFDEEYLPLDPQLASLKRTVSGSTLIFWMKQPDEARLKFENNEGNDFDELVALVQSWNRKLSQVIDNVKEAGGTYTIFARGTDHDLPMIQNLFNDLGMAVPWAYDAKADLRTLMNEAKVGKKDVTMRAGLVTHHALSDCYYQIDCLQEAWRKLRSRVA